MCLQHLLVLHDVYMFLVVLVGPYQYLKHLLILCQDKKVLVLFVTLSPHISFPGGPCLMCVIDARNSCSHGSRSETTLYTDSIVVVAVVCVCVCVCVCVGVCVGVGVGVDACMCTCVRMGVGVGACMCTCVRDHECV